MEHRLRGKGGRPWAPPTLVCHWSGRHRGAWVPDPGCLAQRAHRAEPMLTTSSRAAAHHKTSTGKRRLRYHTRASSTGHGMCAAHHTCRVSVANGQPAPRRCYAPVIGTLGHCSPAGGSATTGQPYPAGSARTMRGATVQDGEPPSSKCHTPAGTCRQWGQQQPSAPQLRKTTIVVGPTCHSP